MTSTRLNSAPQAQWSPKLYEPSPHAGDGEPSAAMSLMDYFLRHFRPRKLQSDAGAAPRNLEQIEESLGLCCQAFGFARKKKGRYDGPRLEFFDHNDDAAAAFRQWLAKRPGRRGQEASPNTVRKHLTAVEAVVKSAGPSGARLIEAPPKFCKPRAVYNPNVERLSLDQLAAWLAACDGAKTPKWCCEIEPHLARAWNQSLIVFCYNTGLRIGEAVQTEAREIIEIDGSKWYDLPAAKAKGKSRGRLVALNSAAIAAIAAAPKHPSGFLFYWPHTLGYLSNSLGKLYDAAGLPGGRWTRVLMHGLRRACNSELHAVSPNQVYAQAQLGHGRSVNSDFYLHRGRELAACVERLPQPAWNPDREGDQLLLF